jgi:hypothetical protein
MAKAIPAAGVAFAIMRYSILPLLLFAVACSQSKPVGRRIFLANRHLSLILPDSNLTTAKPVFWGPHCGSCSFSRDYFFHNRDSTTSVGVDVKIQQSNLGSDWPWKWLVNEQRTREEFVAKNRNLFIVEKLIADSVSRTVVIVARTLDRRSPLFMKEVTVYKGQHFITFRFIAPDNPQMREAVANSQASIFIDPHYLAGPAESYADFRDQL